MKKILPLFGIAMCCSLYSCKSDQQKAEAKVKSFLDSTLNDPNGYQSINFYRFTVFPETYLATKEGSELNLNAMAFNNKELRDIKLIGYNIISVSKGLETFQEYEKNRDSLKKQDVYDTRMADSLYKLINQRLSTFKSSKIDHYTIMHVYRAKNKYGTLQLQASRFYIKDLNDGAVRIDTTIYNPN